MSGVGLCCNRQAAIYALDYGGTRHPRRSPPITWTGGYRELQNERTHFSTKPSSRKKIPCQKQSLLETSWCHFSKTTALFNQVIHHYDKVKPKKLSSFTLMLYAEGYASKSIAKPSLTSTRPCSALNPIGPIPLQSCLWQSSCAAAIGLSFLWTQLGHLRSVPLGSPK